MPLKLLFMSGPNCPNCRVLKPILEQAIKEVERRYGPHYTFDVEHLNVEEPESGQILAQRFEVQSIPQVLFLDDPKTTVVTEKLMGVKPRRVVEQWLESLLQKELMCDDRR